MPIRQRLPPVDDFANEFLSSVRPSAIAMEDFIDWARIEEEISRYDQQFDWLEQQDQRTEPEFIDTVANQLLLVPDTREWITFFFALLGHSQNKTDYTALEGLWKFQDVTKAIDTGNRDQAHEIAEVLTEIGLKYVVDHAEDLRDHFRGYKVGMESHKRKNRQGTSFENALQKELNRIAENLRRQGYEIELVDEYGTAYRDESGQSKTVDFAFLRDGHPEIVFEANSYTGGGSKPSEVKRAYDRVSSRMRRDGIEFVWVTDGQGWPSSLSNLLQEAYVDIIDIYNLDMVQQELTADIRNYLENGPVGSEEDIIIPR